MQTQESSRDDVRRELELVLSSTGFVRNERQSKFLRFLVERHLEGRESELKESVIAVEVFGRDPGYDPKLDGIVRTEAMRLRTRLDKYYATEGSGDLLIIELPKGGYRPVIRARPAAVPGAKARDRRRVSIAAALAAAAMVTAVTAAAWWSTRAADGPFTVAVLPFENLGDDVGREHFTDGLTDEIIRSLSVIDGLTVPSRTSSFALRGKSLSAGEAGKQLRADYLVEGAVTHAGDRLRVTVALVRVRDDVRLWTGRFDRKLTDVFAIQDEISRGIVNGLRLKLNSGPRQYETNLAAYDLYLRGRHTMASFPSRVRPVGIIAVQYFEQAIGEDPNYAIAYAGLADTLLAIDENVVFPERYAEAEIAAKRAVQLDPLLSEAQSAFAAIRAREFAWQDAERGFRRATELNANNAMAHLKLGSVLVVQGRFEEGLEEIRTAVTLDPLSPYMNTEFASALLLAGRNPEAIDQLRQAIALDPSRTRPYTELGRALYLDGKTAEAMTVFDDSIKRWGATADWAACAAVRAGQRDKAVEQVDARLKIARGARSLARIYACLGEEERALGYLEQSLARHEPGVAEILQAPELASMRGNPRFAMLRQKVNLAP